MDPYARLRVGHNVYETPTCQVTFDPPFIHSDASENSLSQPDMALLQNGSKEPKWNKTINCFLMVGIK